VLPVAFVDALDDHEELIVSSREDGRERSVRAWYVVMPSGTIYLFNYAFALRVARWRKDPWVKLTVPGGGPSVEGTVRFVGVDELDDVMTQRIVERWGMWGATTAEGLLRMLRDRSHILVRVDVKGESAPEQAPTAERQ
jgi:hypothetical protein